MKQLSLMLVLLTSTPALLAVKINKKAANEELQTELQNKKAANEELQTEIQQLQTEIQLRFHNKITPDKLKLQKKQLKKPVKLNEITAQVAKLKNPLKQTSNHLRKRKRC